MKNFQIIVFLTFVGFLFTCKNTNSSESNQQTSINSTDSTIEDTQKTEKEKTVTTLYAWVDKLRIREQPTTKSEIVAEVKEGTSFIYLNEKTDYKDKISLRGTLYNEPWLKIKTQDDKVGWVYGGAVKFYEPIVDSNPSPYDKCMEYRKKFKFDAFYKCEEQVRKKQLKKDARFISPVKNGLTFTLLTGEKVMIENDTSESTSNTIVRKYSHYLPKLGYFVTSNTFWEGSGYSLINDKSGNEIRLSGYPKPSPDYKHVITTSADAEVQMSFNGIEIYGFKNGKFKKLLEKAFSDVEPHMPIWVDEKTIEVDLVSLDPDVRPRKIKITMDENGNWNIPD